MNELEATVDCHALTREALNIKIHKMKTHLIPTVFLSTGSSSQVEAPVLSHHLMKKLQNSFMTWLFR